MSRTETKRATIFILAIWVLIAGFAAAAFAQNHIATASLSNRNEATHPRTAAFDPSPLPPVDSIGAQTSIAAFMQSGVPVELQIAALRRAWSMDPAIRDFKGLQENDWDFDSPTDIAGFGDVDPDHVQWMQARLFAEPVRSAAHTPQRPGNIYSSILSTLTSWLGTAQGAVRD